MKTRRCHLLTCSFLLLNCIQPAKAMEGSPHWGKTALFGGTALAALAIGTLIWKSTHPQNQNPSSIAQSCDQESSVPHVYQELSYMPELRAHLATFATLNVHSNSMSVAQFEQDDAYGQAILRQGSLSLSKSEGSDWAEAYPILTAAARIQADMRFLKQAGPEATTAIQQETATLWKRLITSQEILDEIARQQEETAQTQDHA